jgi:DNA-binding transcriptional LysR family regulator
MNNLNWDGFRFFTAAAEAGSMSAAALALGSNQSTVSRHIDQLEDSLGIKLFKRSSKGLRLTEQGQAVYEHAREIEQAVKKTYRAAQDTGLENNTAASGTVRLSLPEGLGQEVLIPLLDQFYRLYPGVKLIFNMSATTANLSQGEADVAVRLFRPEETGLVIKHLGEMRLGLYASAEYQSAYGLPAQLKDVRKHKVITYGELLSILPEN